MLDDTKLRIFKAVAEEGGFTKAAHRLGITQPAVSQSIAELERTTGKSLVIRLHNRTELSDDGRILYSHAAGILEKYDDLQNSLDGKDAVLAMDRIVFGVSADATERVCTRVLPYLREINPELEICITGASRDCDIRIFVQDNTLHIDATEELETSPVTTIIRNRLKP